MQAEHLKGWLEEARKEEAAAAKVSATEGITEELGGTGGEETEERMDKESADMKNRRGWWPW